jgi:hypothetical protein
MTSMALASMTPISFSKRFIFFKRLITNEISQNNKHLLVLNARISCHSNAIEKAQQFELDMITLPPRTSHALYTLNVACFKPFKTTFKQ